VTFVTGYGFDAAGRVIQETTPNYTVINYTRDAVGRVTAVNYALRGQGTPTPVISNVTYYPYGPVASITYADGRVLTRSYDQDYVVSGVNDTATGGLALSFARDVMGNLTQTTVGTGTGAPGNTFVYDGLNRLTTVDDLISNPIAAYTYDGTGNRLSKQLGTAAPVPYTYPYPTGSHQLVAVGSGANTVARSYDAMGNTTALGANTQSWTYDSTERMYQFSTGGTAQMAYLFNGLGQRVAKLPTGNTAGNLYTVYDETGQIIGDYNYTTVIVPVREMIWMDGMPVGVLTPSGSSEALSYIEPDQIGTPRVAISASTNAAVWTWSPLNDPFGETQPTGSITLNNRFPGQVYDSESGLSYNYFRDYDSSTDRETESDPMGLRGGISTYSYAKDNPLSNTDPTGLITNCELQALRDIVNKYGYGPTDTPFNFRTDPTMQGHAGSTNVFGISYIGTNPSAGLDQYSGNIISSTSDQAEQVIITGLHENFHQAELRTPPGAAYIDDNLSEKLFGASLAETVAEHIVDNHPGIVDEYKKRVKDCACQK